MIPRTRRTPIRLATRKKTPHRRRSTSNASDDRTSRLRGPLPANLGVPGYA
jgi:hypothetical protein